MNKLINTLLLFFLTFCHLTYADIKVTDDEDHELVFKQPLKRVVSLSPHASELLFAAGASNQVVGTVTFSDYPEAATRVPIVGSYNKLNIEAILAKQPQLIFAWTGGNPAEQIHKLKQLGLKVYISEPKNYTGVADNLRDMGRLLGTPEVADKAAERFLQQLQQLRQDFPPAKKIRVFYQVWNQPLMTISNNDLIGHTIEFCSGENVFGDLSVIAPRVSLEAVIKQNPDAIIAGMTEDRKGWLDQWQQWTAIKAVKNHHVFAVDADLVVRQSPRVLQGVRQMCERIDEVRQWQQRQRAKP